MNNKIILDSTAQGEEAVIARGLNVNVNFEKESISMIGEIVVSALSGKPFSVNNLIPYNFDGVTDRARFEALAVGDEKESLNKKIIAAEAFLKKFRNILEDYMKEVYETK